MNLNLTWNKIRQTVSGGDYFPVAPTPAALPERRELISRIVPIHPSSANFHPLDAFSHFLESHRKSVLLATGLVIIGTYGPAAKDVCNIVGEMMVLNQEAHTPLRPPVWFLMRRAALARRRPVKAQAGVIPKHQIRKPKTPTV